MLTKVVNQVFPLASWEFELFQDEEGNYSFHGATVCDYFEIKNASVSIQRQVDEDWRFKAPVELGKGSDAWMIREPGLYQLAMKAKTPMAKEFQRWVYSVLLPKLRADGGYIMPNATSEQIRALTAKNDYLQKRRREVYGLFREIAKFNCPAPPSKGKPFTTEEQNSLFDARRQTYLQCWNAWEASSARGSVKVTIDEVDGFLPKSLAAPWRTP
jgi:prophage antirepressor-like protein